MSALDALLADSAMEPAVLAAPGLREALERALLRAKLAHGDHGPEVSGLLWDLVWVNQSMAVKSADQSVSTGLACGCCVPACPMHDQPACSALTAITWWYLFFSTD